MNYAMVYKKLCVFLPLLLKMDPVAVEIYHIDIFGITQMPLIKHL